MPFDAHLIEPAHNVGAVHILDQLPVMVLLFSPTGQVRYVNEHLEHVLGWSLAEWQERDLLVECYPDARTRAQVLDFMASASGETRTFPTTTRDGGIVPTRWRSIASPTSGTIAIGMDLSAEAEAQRDLSAAKKANEALHRRLMHADRMASIGQLAAGVAHEINNPSAFVSANLRVLRGATMEGRRQLRILAKRLPKDLDRKGQCAFDALQELLADSTEILSECGEGISRIESIARDLNTFARVDSREVECVSMREVVRSAVNMTRNEIRHRANLVTDIRDVPPVSGNRGRLGQVVLNLLMNAAQAIEPGGAIDHEVRVTLREKRGRVLLTVRDTGCGMSEATRKRIFDPFFTTKARGHGTGLGLSLAADIAQQHGGDLSVRSERGVGTRFEFALPASEGNVTSSNPAPPSTFPAAARRRVLVIDDEQLLLRAYQRTIGKHHDIVTTDSGVEAIALIKRGEHFDIILCDLMMPGMDGASVYDALVELDPEIAARVVFISGGAFTESATKLLQRVPNPVLSKPVDFRELRRLLE